MKSLRKYCLLFITSVIFLLIASFDSSFAEQVEAERIAREPAIPHAVIEGKRLSENKWYTGTFYDLGNVVQGTRRGEWTEVTGWLGRKQNNINVYASFSQLKRFSEKDYTGNAGLYLKFKDYYIHEELGPGWDVDFIYKFQNIAELSHKLYKNLYWQLGYTYRHYPINDTHLVYPGLIYYIGDSYIRADYGLSRIESRGTGQFGALKGSFAVNKRLRWDVGTSVGEWLYDIYGLSAKKEYGYILYTMFNFEVTKDVRLSLGYSYGTERPQFIKRSLNVSLTANF